MSWNLFYDGALDTVVLPAECGLPPRSQVLVFRGYDLVAMKFHHRNQWFLVKTWSRWLTFTTAAKRIHVFAKHLQQGFKRWVNFLECFHCRTSFARLHLACFVNNFPCMCWLFFSSLCIAFSSLLSALRRFAFVALTCVLILFLSCLSSILVSSCFYFALLKSFCNLLRSLAYVVAARFRIQS